MTSSISGSIYLDPLREREAVAGAVNGLLRGIETRAHEHGQRVIWSTIDFNTNVDHVGVRSLTGSINEDETLRHLTISVQTVDPREVSGA